MRNKSQWFKYVVLNFFSVLPLILQSQKMKQVLQIGHSWTSLEHVQVLPEYNKILSHDRTEAILWELSTGNRISSFAVKPNSDLTLHNALAIPSRNIFIANMEHFENGKYYSVLEWYTLEGYEFIGSRFLAWKADSGEDEKILITDIALTDGGDELYCAYAGGLEIIRTADRTTRQHLDLSIYGLPSIILSENKVVLYGSYERKLTAAWFEPGSKWMGALEVPGAHEACMALSPDGKWLAAGIDSGKVVLISTGGKKIKRIFVTDSLRGDITDVMFSSDSKYVMAKNELSGVIRINLRNGSQANVSLADGAYNHTHFTPIRRQKEFLACYGSYFNLYNEDDAFQLKSYETHISSIFHMSCDASGTHLFLDEQIINVDNLKITEISGYGGQFAFDIVPGKYFTLKDQVIQGISVDGQQVTEEYRIPGEGVDEIAVSPDGNWIAATDNNGGVVYLWSRKTDFAKRFFKMKDYRAGVIFTPDSRFMVVSQGGQKVVLVSMDSLKAVRNFIPNRGSIFSYAYDTTRHIFGYLEGHNQLAFYDMGMKKYASTYKDTILGAGYYVELIFNPQTAHWLILNSEGKILVMDTTFHMISSKSYESACYTFCLDTANHKIYISNKSGYVSCWQYGESDTQLTYQYQVISMHKDRKYDMVISTPDFRYFAPKSAISAFHYVEGMHTYPYDQFDFELNNPGAVLTAMKSKDTALKEIYYRAFYRKNKVNGKPDYFQTRFKRFFDERDKIPSVRILNPGGIPPITTDPFVSIDLGVWFPENSKLGKVDFTVNRVPIKWDKGKDLDKITDSLGPHESPMRFTFALSEGRNTFRFKVEDTSGIESFTQSVEVVYRPLNPPKKKIYFVGIAVSEYKDHSMDLRYAAKDIRDMAALFSDRAKKENMEISIDTLINQKATVENIQKLRAKLLKSHIDDIVIMAISGHGLLDSTLDFYYATYDCDFRDPGKRGVKYESLENLLKYIPSRNRLMMVDACHSGEVDKEAARLVPNQRDTVRNYAAKGSQLLVDSSVSLDNSFELMRLMFDDFSSDNGIQVISASAGNEYALESDRWHNGVFTYSIIHGLTDSVTDANEDGKISVNELKRYVSRQVIQLTGGKQNPTSRKENQENDFGILKTPEREKN